MALAKQKKLPIGNLENFQRERHIFDLTFTKGIGRLSVITSNIIRVQFTTGSDWSYKPLISIEEKEWKSVPIQIKRHAEKLDITTPRLIISLVFRPFNIRIYDHEGHLLSQDDPKTSVEFNGDEITVLKKIPPGVACIGLGDLPGPINRAGKLHKFEMLKSSGENLKSHHNTQLIFPLFCYKSKETSIGYFLDNANHCAIDLRQTSKGKLSMATENGDLDYYCFVGSDYEEVIREYSTLIGNCAFPPRWSLEIMKGLESSLDIKSFLKSFKAIREEFLLTSSVMTHQPQKDSTGFWDDRPRKLLKSFKRSDQIPHFLMEMDQKLKLKMIPKSKLSLLKRKGALLESSATTREVQLINKDTAVLDPFFESSHNYIYDRLSPLFADSLRGVEIQDPCPPWTRKNIKSAVVRCVQEIVSEDGESIEKLIHEVDATNLLAYMPNGLVKGIHKAYKKSRPDLRPLIVSSCGFAGIQRYAVVRPIHGELTWDDLDKYLTRLLSLNISGAPLLCIDIVLEKEFDEVFLSRMIQCFAFVPMIKLRLSGDHNLEKLLRAEKFLRTLDSVFNMRELWLPYLYQLMWTSHTEGRPILYPIIFFYPDWKHALDMQDQFMIGEFVLVAPVIKKKNIRKIHLPPGDWADSTSYKVYEGNQTIDYPVDNETIPIFYREGAIVPHFINEVEGMHRSVMVTFFPKNDLISETYIYDDDGDSTKYLNEEKSHVHLRLSSTKKGYVLKLSRRQGRINPSWSNYILCFIRSRLDIQRVVYNRNELGYFTSLEELIETKTGFFLDDEKELLYVKIPYEREGGVVRF